MQQFRTLEHLGPTYPRSDLICAAIDDGRYIHVSGTVGFVSEDHDSATADPSLPAPVADSIEGQTTAIFDALVDLLSQADLSLNSVVKLNAYLVNLQRDSAGYNRVFRDYFGDHKPARTTVEVGLIGPMLIEIDCVAAHPVL